MREVHGPHCGPTPTADIFPPDWFSTLVGTFFNIRNIIALDYLSYSRWMWLLKKRGSSVGIASLEVHVGTGMGRLLLHHSSYKTQEFPRSFGNENCLRADRVTEYNNTVHLSTLHKYPEKRHRNCCGTCRGIISNPRLYLWVITFRSTRRLLLDIRKRVVTMVQYCGTNTWITIVKPGREGRR